VVDNFDLWNKQKRLIGEKIDNKFCKVREIWWCYLGFNIGHEENGKGSKFTRPVLVIKKFGPNNILVVPLTTSNIKSKFQIDIGLISNKKSKALISQIRTIDSRRLINKISILTPAKFKEIRKTVRKI
jgi:mRNA-degrading endonuclease toxin of MazEF toxin-antitoxin module